MSAALTAESLGELARQVPREKPPIEAVAAMPYPLSVLTMRKHYNPLWGMGKDGDVLKWKVGIDYSYRVGERWSCEVEAVDEEEAKKLAENLFDECPDADADDCSIDEIEAKVVS